MIELSMSPSKSPLFALYNAYLRRFNKGISSVSYTCKKRSEIHCEMSKNK